LETQLPGHLGHVVRVGGAIATEGAKEGEDVLVDDDEHLGRRGVLEAGPAQLLVRAVAPVVAGGEGRPFHRALQPQRLALLQRVQLVQPADERQVGDLLDDFERVGNAARPEGVLDLVGLAADFAGKHAWSSVSPGRARRSRVIRYRAR
jgi:hypothetical protein